MSLIFFILNLSSNNRLLKKYEPLLGPSPCGLGLKASFGRFLLLFKIDFREGPGTCCMF